MLNPSFSFFPYVQGNAVSHTTIHRRCFESPRALAFATGLSVTVAIIAGCRPNASGAEGPPPPPEVDVAKPLELTLAEWDEYTGRIAAVESVEVRARVSGYLQTIHFTAGQLVRQGDILFTIDPAPFEAEVERAEAELAAAKAQAELAAFDLGRVEELGSRGQSSDKEYRDYVFADRSAKAAVARAEASLRAQRLDLSWSKVTAPISGRISREQVTVGNLISGGSVGATLLTTIVKIDPVHCYFDVSEQDYLKYTRMNLSGERRTSRETPNPVRVALTDETEFIHEGHMDFVENVIDRATGTLRGRALLRNPSDLLLPGLFVRLRLIGSGLRPTILLPDQAISADQARRIVFVVDEQGIVSARQVEPGRLMHGLRQIRSGLTAADRVVVNGVQRVAPGTRVSPREVVIPAPPDERTAAATTSSPAPEAADAP